MSFSQLGLAPSLYTPLAAKGYERPTAVQSAAIPLVLNGTDLLARAQTGTGKTAAFALPMIERLLLRHRGPRAQRPRGLVLVPTRELALQVERALTEYGSSARLRVTAIFGGVPMGAQIASLRRGTDIVVATPGRLIDHMQRRMLDMGSLAPLRRVLPALPATRQTLLFSATFSPAIVQLSAEFTRNPARVDVSNDDAVAPTITHRVHRVAPDRKGELLVHLLTQPPVGQTLVFCKTKRGADRVGDHLERAGLKPAVIHGNKSQGARTRSLADFKAGRVTVLVATDIAARGLDIAQLPLVVNYDLPLVAEDYIHRVGRTGRAGVAGRAISLVTGADRDLLRAIQQLLLQPLETMNTDRTFERETPARPAAQPARRRTRPFRRSGRELR
jgi:ATP-dependent RNA helicase RhlE